MVLPLFSSRNGAGPSGLASGLASGLVLSLTLAACGDPPPVSFQGYVEGEFVYLAAPAAGYLERLDAPRGSRLAAGAPVFALAADPDRQALSQAEAQARSATEKAANLDQPRRVSEVAALRAQLAAAEATAKLSSLQLKQQEALAAKGFIASVQLDSARTAQARDAAQVDNLRAQLATYEASYGRLPEVQGARADALAAQAGAAQKRWQLERKAVTAPAEGVVSETYYRPGEWVPAGQPVAAFLPDGARKLRFFVPETALAGLKAGQTVTAQCDGCPAPVSATVVFIAAQAEYTPPVIYSKGAREKLVFRVEALPRPDQAATLRPGLPMDVRLQP